MINSLLAYPGHLSQKCAASAAEKDRKFPRDRVRVFTLWKMADILENDTLEWTGEFFVQSFG